MHRHSQGFPSSSVYERQKMVSRDSVISHSVLVTGIHTGYSNISGDKTALHRGLSAGSCGGFSSKADPNASKDRHPMLPFWGLRFTSQPSCYKQRYSWNSEMPVFLTSQDDGNALRFEGRRQHTTHSDPPQICERPRGIKCFLTE